MENWFHNNVPQMTYNDHVIRMVEIKLDSNARSPTRENLIALGEFICATINSKSQKNKLVVEPDDFIWSEDATYSGVLGDDRAMERCYEEIRTVIDQHFRRDTFNVQLARI